MAGKASPEMGLSKQLAKCHTVYIVANSSNGSSSWSYLTDHKLHKSNAIEIIENNISSCPDYPDIVQMTRFSD